MGARMCKFGFVALAVLFVFPTATLAQIPTVGPGKCVSNCAGGGSGGHRGGGRGLSGIGGAIGTGIAVGTILNAIQSAKPQGGDQGSQRSKEPARERHPQKPAKDEPVKEAKKPAKDEPVKEANKPANTNTNGSNWSGCTGKVGTVWNAGNCGHPGSASTGTGQRAHYHLIPYFVPIAMHQFVEALPCPNGFQKVGETFYGGTKCAPIEEASSANNDCAAHAGTPFFGIPGNPDPTTVIEKCKSENRNPTALANSGSTPQSTGTAQGQTSFPAPPPPAAVECQNRIKIPPEGAEHPFDVSPGENGECIIKFRDDGTEIRIDKNSIFEIVNENTPWWKRAWYEFRSGNPNLYRPVPTATIGVRN
jgi:hypothetical protein